MPHRPRGSASPTAPVRAVLLALLALPPLGAAVRAGEAEPHPGYRLLTEKAYLPADFDQETFDALWRVWPEPLRMRAAGATPEERRRMAFARYGLTPRPDDPTRPLQYVVDERGRWTMNCFACHGGGIAGRAVPGLPNARFALATLTEEVRATKTELSKPYAHMDVGGLFMPLGESRGTTNAAMFGVALLHGRDRDLARRVDLRPPPLDHHDLDAPPLWHFRKRRRLYMDGFAPKGHRPLMQFLLVPANGAERFREWEEDFATIAAYLATLEPPRFPGPVDAALAARGARVYRRTCAECHGGRGPDARYPNRIVPLEEVGTDPVRLHALTPELRARYAETWFARYGRDEVLDDPGGYAAPPLDGIWASAPYLHNGSVPTLWHLLHPEERPAVWRPRPPPADYDRARVGLAVEVVDDVPPGLDARARREYFDTRLRGKSAAGHTFPASLPERDRRALLEYLKTDSHPQDPR